uniref:Uncharacterized protein n=1 Tax=viral metagenome TaxID=1070528 RepID=A0A6C0ACX7_9ZZZZ
MQVQINNLPKFLKNSKFYENLDTNDNEVITIPNLKIDDEINNFEDFKNLVETLDFFDFYKYPKSFIKYYKNNSQEVFDFLKNDLFKNELMLKKFCGLRIKNYKQFFVTYKIINLYKLNPEDYNYYIDYAVNNINEFITDEGYLIGDYGLEKKISKTEILRPTDEKYLIDERYLIDDLIYQILSTKILKLRPKYIKEGKVYLYSSVKKLGKYNSFAYPIKGISIIPIECFDKILEAIKNNSEYEYNHNERRKKYPAYIENILYLRINNSDLEYTITQIYIHEFNKNNILEEFEKVIEWISDESKKL